MHRPAHTVRVRLRALQVAVVHREPSTQQPLEPLEPAAPEEFVAERALEEPGRRELIGKYFARFDFDGCGTISSGEDVHMLCTTLCVKLQIPVSPDQIQRLMEGSLTMGSYSLGEFQTWFDEVFSPDQVESTRTRSASLRR